jgi:hypothetical protein
MNESTNHLEDDERGVSSSITERRLVVEISIIVADYSTS